MSANFAVSPTTTTTPLQFPEWQREYQEALFETNPARLPQRVMIAEFVLLKRLRAIGPTTRTRSENDRKLKTRYPSCV
jgi:hypothetical protein